MLITFFNNYNLNNILETNSLIHPSIFFRLTMNLLKFWFLKFLNNILQDHILKFFLLLKEFLVAIQTFISEVKTPSFNCRLSGNNSQLIIN